MAITPDTQKKEQQHQPQNGPLDYAHICKCIAMFFVVAGVVLMFFETGLDPEQKEQIKRLHLDLFLFFFSITDYAYIGGYTYVKKQKHTCRHLYTFKKALDSDLWVLQKKNGQNKKSLFLQQPFS